MNDKAKIVNGLYRVAGFIDALGSNGYEYAYIDYLRAAVDFINNQPSHEEFKASWLSLLNAIHTIDPQWQEKSQGDSEWQKAIDFISNTHKALECAEGIIQQHRKARCTGDAAEVKSEGAANQHCASSSKSGQFKNLFCYQPVFPHSFSWVLMPHPVVGEAVEQLLEELSTALQKHPAWPSDTVHATAILNEEAGELTQAAIDYHYHNGSLEKVRREAAQVGAMAIRVLINLPYAEPSPITTDIKPEANSDSVLFFRRKYAPHNPDLK